MAGYLGASPVPQSIQKKESFTATASQTTFNTTGYTDGNFINVYLNGVRLINGTDYTATNGSDIVLTSAASASDVLDFETFSEFQLIDQEFGNSVIVKNGTHEDTDGGRESTLIFKGEQSGGEISTLAEIEASHDGTADDEKGDLIFRTNDGSDGSSPTEAARIDSSQNLLVGKTDTTNATTTAGHQLDSDGRVYHVRDGGAALQVGRKTDFGNIAAFYKDGTTAGTLGSDSGGFYIDGEASHTGLRFKGGAITPRLNATQADGTVNIGNSTERFQDLYLSGGAYIGGTVAANKLEDYEEGTWTPTLTGFAGSPNITNAYYTKVGRKVLATVRIILDATTDGSQFVINGFPFTTFVAANNIFGGYVVYSNSSFANNIYPLLDNNATTAKLFKASGGSFTYSDLGASNEIRLNFTYFTT